MHPMCPRRILQVAIEEVSLCPTITKAKMFLSSLKVLNSAFYLWINGIKIGYSQDSKLSATFEISEAIHDGENTVAVQVFSIL